MIRTRMLLVGGAVMVATAAFGGEALKPVPQGVYSQKVLSTALAVEAAQAALAACNAQGYHASVSVVDRHGDTRVQLYGDGGRAASPETSRKKAYTSAMRGISSGEYGKSVAANPPAPGAPVDPNMTVQTGGLPVIIDGDTVAGLAVSGDGGGAKDEGCAAAGLAKIGRAHV